MSIMHLTSGNFDEIISGGMTLVDFWAAWCLPCRMVAPVIDELAAEYEGRVRVAKVDIDSEGALAVRYGVMSIPTVVLFKDGKEVKRFIGAQDKQSYRKELESELP